MTKTQQLFSQEFPDLAFQYHYPLRLETYFKIGGEAEVFFVATKKAPLKQILSFAYQQTIPVTIFGAASNVLVTEKPLPGLVIKMTMNNWQIVTDTSSESVLVAEAGMKTSSFVGKTAQLGLTGMEGFIGVPGTLGGAIYNNAHYLQFLFGDFIISVTAFNMKTGEEQVFSREKCQFAYEQSIFQTHPELVILSAQFSLQKGLPTEIQEKLREAQERRQKTQPLDLPSSGCFFRNPANTPQLTSLFPQFIGKEFVPAGFLIEQAGLKGVRSGDIQISEKHAAFLVNLGNGKEADVHHLVELIKHTVKQKYGVDLKEEVFYLQQKEN